MVLQYSHIWVQWLLNEYAFQDAFSLSPPRTAHPHLPALLTSPPSTAYPHLPTPLTLTSQHSHPHLPALLTLTSQHPSSSPPNTAHPHLPAPLTLTSQHSSVQSRLHVEHFNMASAHSEYCKVTATCDSCTLQGMDATHTMRKTHQLRLWACPFKGTTDGV